ncbi:MAG TPA: aminotransferase class I/II-fold pyridoxal phosphate-dependent enzyme [Gemmatimonadaceae bacterium]|nr:aminotransferase class I/II-fold pyridoxal phosphate-dependent enzyme [Gemmatimonadaceae bacterium]
MIDDILAELEADTSLEVGEQFAAVTARYFESTRSGKGQVSTPRSAEELAQRFSEAFPREGRPVTEIIERLEREVLADANKYYHPMYMGHQTSAPLPVGVWMESVIGALNQSLAVWEMSPTATMIEHQIVGWLGKLAGYGTGAGGTLTSGGTEANFTAMLAARNAAVPNSWEDGLGADPPVVVYGEHAHYAVTRAIGQLGMGRRRGIPVPSRNFRIDVDLLVAALDRLRKEDKRVMAVVATAGTTATGSFDDLESVGALCEERGIWLHVDGAHGAGALLSSRPPRALKGLRHSRSLAWDPHKMMLLPLATGMVLTRDEGDLERAFAQQAPYLFHAGKSTRVIDQGMRSFQCSRRADVLKLWFVMQRFGSSGLGRMYDHLCNTARLLYEAIQERDDFENIHEPESNILCFRYLGAKNRKKAGSTMSSSDIEQIDALNRELRPRYNREGTGWITATVLDGRPVLRVTMMNPRTGAEHVKALLDGLAAKAKEIESA